jgi:hypothetical protein
MDLSKLSAADKRILYAAIGVVIGGIIGIIDVWGIGATIGLLAGLAAIFVLLQPQVAPTVKLPAPKATLLFACGAIAAAGFVLSALVWLPYVLDVTRIYSLLFDLGLVSALILGWLTWMQYKPTMPASGGTTPPAPPAPPAA